MMVPHCLLRNAPNSGVSWSPQRAPLHGKWTSALAMELRVRILVACVVLFGAAAACNAPGGAGDGAGNPAAGDPANNPNTFRADVDHGQAYAGQWAQAKSQCGDEKKIWTIEPRRMAIVPAMRFCAFESVYVSEGPSGADTTWSTSAKCLADGRESHDFLFFRVKDNLHEMRVTFNDSKSVELVRCPMKS